MARTRAGLSGRPTCRPGVICPGLSAPQGWPLAAMPAGLPVGTLRPCLTSAVELPRAASAALRSSRSGRRPAVKCLLAVVVGFGFRRPVCPGDACFWLRRWCHTARQVPRLRSAWPKAIHCSGRREATGRRERSDRRVGGDCRASRQLFRRCSQRRRL